VELVDVRKLWLHGMVWGCLDKSGWELAHISVGRHVGRGLAALVVWGRANWHLLALQHGPLHVRLKVLVVLHLVLQHGWLHALHRAAHLTQSQVTRIDLGRAVGMLVFGCERAGALF